MLKSVVVLIVAVLLGVLVNLASAHNHLPPIIRPRGLEELIKERLESANLTLAQFQDKLLKSGEEPIKLNVKPDKLFSILKGTVSESQSSKRNNDSQ